MSPRYHQTALVLTAQASTARALENCLSRERFAAEIFSRSSDATQALDPVRHDMLIVDDFLDAGRGLHFIRRARVRGFEAPVVLISDDYRGVLSKLRAEGGICRPIAAPVSHPALCHCLRLLKEARSQGSTDQQL